VFAYDSIDMRTMSDEFISQVLPQPHDERVDAVWVLGKGAYNWATHDPITVLPAANPGAWLAVGDISPDEDVLMNMMLVLDTHLVNVYMPPVNMIPYANNATLLENTTLRGPLG